MALRHLESTVMLQLSATWLDPASDANKALLAVPDLATFLPRLEKPHATLGALLQPGHDARITAIVQEELEIDFRHDHIIRGTFAFLSGCAELLDGNAGKALLELRDFLIPDGLSATQKSYRTEAAQAAQLSERITPAIKSQLDSLNVGLAGQSKPLSALVEEWVLLGKKLGHLEDEKARLQDSPAQTTAQAIVKARNLWIRTVNALVAQADLAELDEASDRLVFGPLRAASKNAERKVKNKSSDAIPSEPTGGAAVPPTTSTTP